MNLSKNGPWKNIQSRYTRGRSFWRRVKLGERRFCVVYFSFQWRFCDVFCDDKYRKRSEANYKKFPN
jgi:hypothetical protein